MCGAVVTMTMFLLSFGEKPLGMVRTASLPAASWSVAPPACDIGMLLEIGRALFPSATRYVPVAEVAFENGVMVTAAPSLRLTVRLPPASVVDLLNRTVMGIDRKSVV